MPTSKKTEQKHTINETKRAKKEQKELQDKEKEMKKLAAQALRQGSSQAGKMMASLRKKSP